MIDAETICAAKNGNADAWNKILRHYRPYISSCCKRRYLDKHGNVHFIVDEDMVEQIESTLMLKVIMNFDIGRPSRETIKS